MEEHLQYLLDNPTKIQEIFKIDELDKLIHSLFPGLQFEMNYAVENGVYSYSQKVYFNASCKENLVNACGIFANALKNCYIETSSMVLKWDEKKNNYYLWFQLELSYQLAGGGTNGMTLASFMFTDNQWKIFPVNVKEDEEY